MIRGNTSFFITGGTMGQDTPSYVERRADTELYEGLRQGEFCYVLTARQMGKSSLMVRTARRLREDGFSVVTLDLTVVGQNLTLEQWYYGLLNLVGRQLGLRAELRAFWVEHPELGSLQRFMLALEQVVLAALDRPPEGLERPAAGLVVFVDEIDSVRSLPFSTDELFAAIRQYYNRRAEEPALNRMTFCLLGVASPSQLIQDARVTPFNVGRRIELHDFREAEARPLAVGLQLGAAGDPLRPPRVAERLLGRVLFWTQGHPYLTQRFCQEVAENPKVRDARGVDRICRSLFLTPGARNRDDNLLFVQERLVNREDDVAGYLDLYRRIRAGQRVRCDETDPRVPELRLSGIVAEEKGYLRVRNRIYREVFDPRWINARMPDAEHRRRQAAYRHGLVRGITGSCLLALILGGLATGVALQNQRIRRLSVAAELDRGVRALQAGDPLGLLNLLEGCRLSQPDPELWKGARSLWQGWHAETPHLLAEMLDPGGPLTVVRMDGRGRLMAWGCPDGSTWIWDRAHPEPAHPLSLPGGGRITELVFSRTQRYLLILRERDAVLWDMPGSRGERLALAQGEPVSAAFLDQGSLLAIQSRRGLDVRQVDRLQRPYYLWHSPGPILTAAYSPGNGLVALSSEQGVWLHELPARKHHKLALARGKAVSHLAFSASGKLLALATTTEGWAWEAPTGRLQSVRVRSSEPIEGVACDERAGAVATWGGRTVHVSSARTGAPLGQPYDHGSNVRAVRFREPDGRVLATVSSDRARFWQVDAATECAPPLAPVGGLFLFAADAELRYLAAASTGRNLQVWSLQVPELPEPPLEVSAALQDSRYVRNGEFLLTADQSACRLWNTYSRRAVPVPVTLGGAASRVTLSPGGQYVASAASGQVRLWELSTGRRSEQRLSSEEHPSCLAFSRDGEWLAQGSSTRRLRVWRSSSPLSQGRTLATRAVPLRLEWGTTGRYLVTAYRRSLELFDLRTGRATNLEYPGALRWMGFAQGDRRLILLVGNRVLNVAVDRPKTPPRELSLSAETITAVLEREGDRLVVASTDNELSVCDLRTMRRQATLRQSDRAHLLALSPDGELLACDEGLTRLQVWDLQSRQRFGKLRSFAEPLLRLEFRADGRQLAIQTETTVRTREIDRTPWSLAQLEMLTWFTLDARSTPHGVEAIPPEEWRLLRDRLRNQ